MALITCEECGNKVSDKAASCPNCGSPIANRSESRGSGTQLTTTQETSKHLKIHSLASGAVFAVGVVMAIGASGSDPGSAISYLSSFVITAGLVWFIATRIRIWWHHG